MVNEYWLLTPGYDPQCQWKGRVMGVYLPLTQPKKKSEKKNNKRWRGILVFTSIFLYGEVNTNWMIELMVKYSLK